MRITAGMNYIDTCCLMMFLNERDSLRNDYGIGRRKAENCVKKGHSPFHIPMPALGEAIWKIREKTKDKLSDSIVEMERLLDNGFMDVVYIKNPQDVYDIARKLSEPVEDERDKISAMDALIVAAATVNPDCHRLYTADSRIISDVRMSNLVDNWRSEHNCPPLKLIDISSILSVR